MKRFFALIPAIALIFALSCCTPKPVQQGMITEGGMTFLASTMTDEKAGTVTVTVTLTNGTGDVLYLSAPELETPDGTTAFYLDMSIPGAECEADTLAETGLSRWLHLDPRETYSETQTFSTTLPATLFVTVRGAGGYEEEFQLTNVALPLE